MLTTKLLSQGYQKSKLVATRKKFYGKHHDLVNPYSVAVSRIVLIFIASDAPQVSVPNLGHTFLTIFPSFRPIGMVGELAYRVMLTIRGRLITSFILGSMSVGLNIRIRHSFRDL